MTSRLQNSTRTQTLRVIGEKRLVFVGYAKLYAERMNEVWLACLAQDLRSPSEINPMI
jgi:hypothetical protein